MSLATSGRVVTLEEAARSCSRWRAERRPTVLAVGIFDLLRAGHARFLEAARRLGERLVVAVRADASANRFGPPGPVLPASDRARLVAALRGVDAVVVFDVLEDLVRTLAPDVFVRGVHEQDAPGGDGGVRGMKTVVMRDEGALATRALITRIGGAPRG